MADFNAVIDHILKWEGGEVNNPNDPGGHTKYGISKRAYPDLDISLLTVDHAKKIYRKDYWDKFRGDDLIEQLKANVIMDFAVNAGVSRSIKLAQRVAGVTVDGIVGPQTMAGIYTAKNFVVDFTLERVKYYTDLAVKKKSMRTFHFGWIRRTLSFLP